MNQCFGAKRFPSNSQTGCINMNRLAVLQKLAAVNLFTSQEELSVQSATHQKQQSQSNHNESQRSNSLFDLLNKELSQFSNNTYNMPRQIKSLYSANDSYFPPQKQMNGGISTDVIRFQNQTPAKSLKQSIYEKLLKGKSKNKLSKNNKITTKQKGVVNKMDNVIKQATFRPQKGSLKLLTNDLFKIKSESSSKIKSTLHTQQTPRNYTKYQELLKSTNLLQKQKKREKQKQKQKQNYNRNNRHCFNDIQVIPISMGRQISQSDVNRLNLKKSLQMKKRFFEYNYISDQEPKIGALDLNFQQRQERCVRSRSLKIVQHEINKLKQEMKQCTFVPKLTPYRKQINQSSLASERTYGGMRKSLSKQLIHYR